MNRHARTAIELALVAGAGFAAIALPVALDPSHRDYGSVMRNAVEGFRGGSLGLLALLGFAAGWFGRAPWLLLGAATVAVLPAWSLLDLARGGDHSLLPIEWACYAFYAACGAVGARLGRKARGARSPDAR